MGVLEHYRTFIKADEENPDCSIGSGVFSILSGCRTSLTLGPSSPEADTEPCLRVWAVAGVGVSDSITRG